MNVLILRLTNVTVWLKHRPWNQFRNDKFGIKCDWIIEVKTTT